MKNSFVHRNSKIFLSSSPTSQTTTVDHHNNAKHDIGAILLFTPEITLLITKVIDMPITY